MSAKSAASEGDGSGPDAPVPEVDRCPNARKYALEALEASAAARSPKELAEAYGCESGHMGNVLSELRKEGEIERVDRGLYTSKDEESGGDDLPLSEESERVDTEDSEEGVGEKSEGSTDSEKLTIDDDERAEIGPVEDDATGGIDPTAAGLLSNAGEGYAAVAGVSESEESEESSTGVDDGDDGGISAGTALVAGTLGLATVVLLRGRSSSASTTPTETDETDGPEESDAADGMAYSGWRAQ